MAAKWSGRSAGRATVASAMPGAVSGRSMGGNRLFSHLAGKAGSHGNGSGKSAGSAPAEEFGPPRELMPKNGGGEGPSVDENATNRGNGSSEMSPDDKIINIPPVRKDFRRGDFYWHYIW